MLLFFPLAINKKESPSLIDREQAGYCALSENWRLPGLRDKKMRVCTIKSGSNLNWKITVNNSDQSETSNSRRASDHSKGFSDRINT
jgi:hypothetical protein